MSHGPTKDWLAREQGIEMAEVADLRDEARADRAAERADAMRDEGRPERPCAACGEPTRGKWCSDSCRRAEDGLQPAEVPEDEPWEN